MSLSTLVFWLFDVENIRRHDGCNKWLRWLQLIFHEGWRGLHDSFDELVPLITQEICFFIACISMDISKAFDCLPHCLTICKLHAYGLSRNACTLIASYLYQRKQRVKIGNIRSSWKETDKGVPQGSILEPLIFNIFMNDLFYFVKHANIFNYADDNSVSVSGKELSIVSRLLQSKAEVTVRWFCENAMEANPSKFQGILFKGNKQADDFKLSVNGHDIEFSKSMTSLGICIDDTLTFDSHINDICLKASRQISDLQRLRDWLDYPSRRAIYTSFISSHFNYCPRVWFFYKQG